MRNFLQFVIKNPMAVLLIVFVMGLSGLYSARHMPVDLFPHLDIPVVNVIAHYPGATPEDMELLITRPVENEIRALPGVRRVASVSVQGISRVTAEFTWKTTVRDARQLVQARLARVSGVLPAGVIPRIESLGTTLQEVCGYVIYGAGDPVTLRNIVRHDLAGRLMGVEGVSSVLVLGGDQRAFHVVLRPEALARLHLSVRRIASILKEHNLSSVAGFTERSGREYRVRGDARIRSLDDLRSIPLISGDQRTVLLGAVADVYEGRAPRHYTVHGDGVPAVALVVRKQPGTSTSRVVRGVDQALADLGKLLPPGTHLEKFYDQSEIINEAKKEVLHNVLLGAGLAVLVLYFFLGAWRPTLIVAGTIPVTVLATVALMHRWGLGLNLITLTALALAVGMIVDDAVVVAENIFRHAARTPDPGKAGMEGTAEIAGADASGTFTTVAAFLPLLLVTGIAGIFLRPFGFTVSAALLVSLILSLTLVPMLFSRGGLFRPVSEDFPGNRLLQRMERGLAGTLDFSFRHRRRVLIASLLIAGLSALSLFAGRRISLLPPIDEGAILIEYVMPPGTSLAESNRIGEKLEQIAQSVPEVSAVYRRTGSPEGSSLIEGVNKGELMIKLNPRGNRTRSASAVTASLKASYAAFEGVVFLYHQPTQEKIDESFSGLPALFGVTLYGDDMNKLVSLARRIEDLLSRDPAVTNVVNNTKINPPQVEVRVQEAGLARYGVSPVDVLETLRAARLGIEATRIIREKEEVPVLVRIAVDPPFDPDRIGKLPIALQDGGAIPLERVAKVGVTHAPASITRLNGRREITLTAEVEGSIPAAVSRLRKRFQAVKLPPGYSLEFTGQYGVLMETALEMLLVLAAALLLIYLILAMQFKSRLQPLIILVTVPLSLAGAFIALFIMHQGLDISVAMGVVTLVGVAVNNAIVLIDSANREAASGHDLKEALFSAASVRLRPILLTSLTTIAALLPSAIGASVGSRIFQPFAVTVIGGLVSATFGTLVVIPTLALSRKFDSGSKRGDEKIEQNGD